MTLTSTGHRAAGPVLCVARIHGHTEVCFMMNRKPIFEMRIHPPGRSMMGKATYKVCFLALCYSRDKFLRRSSEVNAAGHEIVFVIVVFFIHIKNHPGLSAQ